MSVSTLPSRGGRISDEAAPEVGRTGKGDAGGSIQGRVWSGGSKGTESGGGGWTETANGQNGCSRKAQRGAADGSGGGPLRPLRAHDSIRALHPPRAPPPHPVLSCATFRRPQHDAAACVVLLAVAQSPHDRARGRGSRALRALCERPAARGHKRDPWRRRNPNAAPSIRRSGSLAIVGLSLPPVYGRRLPTVVPTR